MNFIFTFGFVSICVVIYGDDCLNGIRGELDGDLHLNIVVNDALYSSCEGFMTTIDIA